MGEKVLNVNFAVAKERLKTKGKSTIKKTGESITKLRGKLSSKVQEKKDNTVQTMLAKGIELTKKQMEMLKKAEKKRKG